MDELKQQATEIAAGLKALQVAQRVYDRDMWDIAEPVFANVRHIHLHLSITTGKLARLLEPRDHQSHLVDGAAPLEASELSPVIADLLIHAAQLANAHDLDLGELFAARYRANAARFAPASPLRQFGL